MKQDYSKFIDKTFNLSYKDISEIEHMKAFYETMTNIASENLLNQQQIRYCIEKIINHLYDPLLNYELRPVL